MPVVLRHDTVANFDGLWWLLFNPSGIYLYWHFTSIITIRLSENDIVNDKEYFQLYQGAPCHDRFMFSACFGA